MRTHKGQSTVEYILLVTAVTVVIVMFTTGNGPGTFQNKLQQLYNTTTEDMMNTATYLQVNACNSC